MIRSNLSRTLCGRIAAIVVLAFATAAVTPAAEHRVGVGIHYFSAIDDLVEDDFAIDEDGVAGILSYQYRPGGLLSFELDLEIVSDDVGGVAYILVGKGLYAALGIGLSLSDDGGDSALDPFHAFYAARIGMEFTLLPRLRLDLNLNYRVDAISGFDNVESDAITLGATVRYTLGG